MSDPSRIIVGGGSAGGNLAAALLLRAKDEGLPMPAALTLLTPEIDLTESGDSFTTLAHVSVGLQTLRDVNLLYANGHALQDPYLSPLFGDLSGFPPTLVICGTRDLFLTNAVRMHRRLREAGGGRGPAYLRRAPPCRLRQRAPKRRQSARSTPRSSAGISGSSIRLPDGIPRSDNS
jgi:acetyl esterase/lipase